MKKLYRKFLIWYYGNFKNRITRCNHCKFRVFNNENEAYRKMIHHNLFNCKKLTPFEQVSYLQKELDETKERLLKSILEHEF